jgi:hypothetical protein
MSSKYRREVTNFFLNVDDRLVDLRICSGCVVSRWKIQMSELTFAHTEKLSVGVYLRIESMYCTCTKKKVTCTPTICIQKNRKGIFVLL